MCDLFSGVYSKGFNMKESPSTVSTSRVTLKFGEKVIVHCLYVVTFLFDHSIRLSGSLKRLQKVWNIDRTLESIFLLFFFLVNPSLENVRL